MEELKLHDGSGWWEHSPSRWWAVMRKGTMNLLVGVFGTKEEAKEAYEEKQKEYDDYRQQLRDEAEAKRIRRRTNV